MIITALLTALFYMLKPLLSLLPTISSLPTGLNTAIDWFFDLLAGWQFFVPVVDDLLTIALLIMTVEGAIILFAGINFVYNKIRGSG